MDSVDGINKTVYADITKSDSQQLKDIYTKNLNYGGAIDDYLDRLFSNGEYIGIKCIKENSIQAVFLCSKGINFTIPKQLLEDKIKEKTLGKIVYTLDMIFTKKKMRNRGMQKEMTELAKARLIEKKASFLLAEQWIPYDRKEPEYSLKNHFSREIGIITDLQFYKGIESNDVYCPLCKSNCKCGAKIVLYEI
ncbi:MAG: hypothetical protein Q4D16_08380 [Eubacteriales bacterium]|nr:hypothetical protein [Eubacteriales bacterium]